MRQDRSAASAAAARPAAVAGMFYPAGAEALVDEVDRCLRSARTPPARGERAPKLLLVPHAGYVYSGPVAAQAYALLAAWRGRIRRVVLLGPTHRVAVRGLAAPSSRAFATPLGLVPVDHEALAGLTALPQVVVSDAVHADEHALEVQLPFLQRVLGEFTLVPLAVGRATAAEVAEVLERLWGGDETLIVISSDLSHYLPYAEAQARDRATIERVLRLDTELDHDEACGATPLAGALVAARHHGLKARLLDLRNSGDTAGDRRRVVGYAAVAFDAEAPAAEAAAAADAGEVPADDPALGRALLARARAAIAGALGVSSPPLPAEPAALDGPGATFVTLHCGGELRGCIGTLHAERALRDDVEHHALAAAFADPRFAPLKREEWDALQIEVSLLGEPEPLPVADEAAAHRTLRPGVDGVVLEWRGRRATFLPQVWEQLPAVADFLRALKRKAGLAPDFWSADLQLWRYAVRKFAEAGSGDGAEARP